MDATLQTQAPRRTRAVIIRERVQVRLALDSCGPAIGAILKENGIELPGMSWEKVWPHWLIACDRDATEGSSNEIIGCLQVMPSKPIAYCEMLCVRPKVSFKLRAISIRKLIQQVIATAYHGGASYVACNVDFGNDRFENVVEKLNVVRMCERTLFMKRLKD